MSTSLSKLLLSFEQDCHETVQNGTRKPVQGQIVQLLQDVQNLQINIQEHNHYFKAIQHQYVLNQNSDTLTLCNSKCLVGNQKSLSHFLKNKQKIFHEHFTQNTQKTSKKYSRKSIFLNQQKHGKSKFIENKKNYQPNPRMSKLFSKIQKHHDFFQSSPQMTDNEKEIFFKPFMSLALKRGQMKEKTSFIPQENENQKINRLYKLNPNLMAPKKQKLKKVKSNQIFQ